MQILAITLCVFCLISAALNVYFLLQSKKPQIKRKESIELQEFLVDLMGGKLGMIAVARVDPNDILLRSPRQK